MKPNSANFPAPPALAGIVLAGILSVDAAHAQSPTAAGTPASVTTPGSRSVASRSADIRDIRGPEPIANPWLWAIWTAPGVLLASGAYFTWRWYRRRRLVAEKLPYETALARLEAARALMCPDSVRAFSITVSDIVRLYIEQRFRVRAAHRTTEEFLYDLLEPSDALLGAHRPLLAEFLNHCDLAKFGGWTLSAEKMLSMHDSARSFVLATGQTARTSSAIRNTAASSTHKEIYDSVSSA